MKSMVKVGCGELQKNLLYNQIASEILCKKWTHNGAETSLFHVNADWT